jgi:hypothetical protein
MERETDLSTVKVWVDLDSLRAHTVINAVTCSEHVPRSIEVLVVGC